jgi:hypothetical protein
MMTAVYLLNPTLMIMIMREGEIGSEYIFQIVEDIKKDLSNFA